MQTPVTTPCPTLGAYGAASVVNLGALLGPLGVASNAMAAAVGAGDAGAVNLAFDAMRGALDGGRA